MPIPTFSDSRRRLLAVLPAAAVAGAAPARAADAPVKWTDIKLIDGRVLRGAELQKQAVVVQMWASWCPFCMRQNPHIQKLHEASAGRGLQVLGFTIDRTVEAAREYMARRGYTFPAAMAGIEVEDWFGARRTLPEIYVVEPSGKVVFREGGEMFPEDIAALIRFAAKK
jgi:thiol-disulfide isomerase/thioredoxin